MDHSPNYVACSSDQQDGGGVVNRSNVSSGQQSANQQSYKRKISKGANPSESQGHSKQRCKECKTKQDHIRSLNIVSDQTKSMYRCAYDENLSLKSILKDEAMHSYIQKEYPGLFTEQDVVPTYIVPSEYNHRLRHVNLIPSSVLHHKHQDRQQADAAEKIIFEKLKAMRIPGATFHSCKYITSCPGSDESSIMEHDFVVLFKEGDIKKVCCIEVKSCTGQDKENPQKGESWKRKAKDHIHWAERQLKAHSDFFHCQFKIPLESIGKIIVLPFWKQGPICKKFITEREKKTSIKYMFNGDLDTFDAQLSNYFQKHLQPITDECLKSCVMHFTFASCGALINSLSLEIDRKSILLSENQLSILNSESFVSKYMSVSGPAGTGKTLLILQKIKELKDKSLLTEQSKCLFVAGWKETGIVYYQRQLLDRMDIRNVEVTSYQTITTKEWCDRCILDNNLIFKYIFVDSAEDFIDEPQFKTFLRRSLKRRKQGCFWVMSDRGQRFNEGCKISVSDSHNVRVTEIEEPVSVAIKNGMIDWIKTKIAKQELIKTREIGEDILKGESTVYKAQTDEVFESVVYIKHGFVLDCAASIMIDWVEGVIIDWTYKDLGFYKYDFLIERFNTEADLIKSLNDQENSFHCNVDVPEKFQFALKKKRVRTTSGIVIDWGQKTISDTGDNIILTWADGTSCRNHEDTKQIHSNSSCKRKYLSQRYRGTEKLIRLTDQYSRKRGSNKFLPSYVDEEANIATGPDIIHANTEDYSSITTELGIFKIVLRLLSMNIKPNDILVVLYNYYFCDEINLKSVQFDIEVLNEHLRETFSKTTLVPQGISGLERFLKEAKENNFCVCSDKDCKGIESKAIVVVTNSEYSRNPLLMSFESMYTMSSRCLCLLVHYERSTQEHVFRSDF